MVDRMRIAVVLLLCAVAFAQAEELIDPTRPPVSVSAPIQDVEAANLPTGLQSILMGKQRRAAIIDGETVELGGKHGDAKLIEVNEGDVVLRGAHGRQVLTLFPSVKITQHHVKVGQSSNSRNVQTKHHKTKRVAHGEKK